MAGSQRRERVTGRAGQQQYCSRRKFQVELQGAAPGTEQFGQDTAEYNQPGLISSDSGLPFNEFAAVLAGVAEGGSNPEGLLGPTTFASRHRENAVA